MRAKSTGSAATDAGVATSRARETSNGATGRAKRHARKARCSIAICTKGSTR